MYLRELLINFTDNRIRKQGNQLFEVKPGDTPCNVLVMLPKLGKIRKNQFGVKLKKTLVS